MLGRLSDTHPFRLLSIITGFIHHAIGPIYLFQCYQNEVHSDVHNTVTLARYVRQVPFSRLLSDVTFPLLPTFSFYGHDQHCCPSSICIRQSRPSSSIQHYRCTNSIRRLYIFVYVPPLSAVAASSDQL